MEFSEFLQELQTRIPDELYAIEKNPEAPITNALRIDEIIRLLTVLRTLIPKGD